uniref:Protein FAR1-RELATED SEQUENCE 7 n=1 Tax=Anthurium amnicola TaxID=1678845 RepID=A0A1D1YIE5_9ARAE
MLKSEDESAESHSGLENDGMTGHAVRVEVKSPSDEDNQPADVPVIKESVLTRCEAGLEPYEGMQFESEEAAKVFYNAYARRVGFRIRISKYSRSRRDNSVISRQIVCSKEGFREVRPKKGLFGGLFGERRRQRVVTRVGCRAMIMVKKLSSGMWTVSKFVKEHNHGPVPPRNLEVRVVRDVDTTVEKPIPPERDSSIQEPLEGMEFDSEEAAKSFYNAYAKHMGFRARISKYCRSRRDNSIISRRLVCSKEGFREIRVKKETCDEIKIKRPRAITRIGCKAMIIVKRLSSGKWVVSRFEKEHNHALVTSKKVLHLQPKNCDDKSSASILEVPMKVQRGLMTDGCNVRVQSNFKNSLNVLYTQLCYEAFRYAQEGATTEESYNVAMAALKEAVEKVTAAKRNGVVAEQHSNPVIESSQRLSGNTIFQAKLHGSSSSNDLKQAVSSQELVLLQQPVNLVLIPSGFMSDPADQNQPAEIPFIINTPNSQVIITTSDVTQLTHSTRGYIY